MVAKVLYCIAGLVGCLFATESSRQRYLALLKDCPLLVQNLGNSEKGEIEVILDEERMALIEEKTGRDVGVVKEDRYWIWVNDACKFPSGKEGVYGRILWVGGLHRQDPAIAVVPVTSEGKIVLNCNFRHATRSWEIELPRGLVNAGETAEEAAIREVVEEQGRTIISICRLAEVTPDTGVVGVVVPLFLAKVEHIKAHAQEESEAIEEILELSPAEIKQAFSRGYLECRLKGQLHQIPMRDPFLAFALLRLESRPF